MEDPFLGRNPLHLTRDRLLQRAVEPGIEPLTLAETKLYLRVDGSDDDNLISDLIVAAREMAELWLKRSLITQSWKLAYDYGMPDFVFLPMGPVNSIASVVAFARDGTSQTVDSSQYGLNAAKDSLVAYQLFTGTRIEITYSAGYGDASAIPRPIKQGMLSHIAALYDDRGEGDAMPKQTLALYMPFREVRL